MHHIDITDNPWHWRFLKFMGRHKKFLWQEDQQNTCSYVRELFMAAFWLAFLSAPVFTIASNFVFSVIGAGIFIYQLGFSFDSIRAFGASLPDVLRIFMAVWISLLAIAAVGLIIALTVFTVFTVFTGAQADYLRKAKEKFKETSTYQIAHAWHSNICRPIKMNKDEESAQ